MRRGKGLSYCFLALRVSVITADNLCVRSTQEASVCWATAVVEVAVSRDSGRAEESRGKGDNVVREVHFDVETIDS